ncbi:hypothetical protein G4B88_006646 [Cannabis sativa]|uniref:MADS-box domain-containing protein n=1 Tax=Cannabis sativa TaxID=3483 RepID=A0A7J6GGH8_CANSA|nr:hypothetical protein G4B88_006646 [Cannabis sativa]
MEMNNNNENTVNNDNRNTQSRRINRGRRRVSMTRMTNESNLQVTFSKRRSGLFKKASELCTLCGVQIAIIVFSPGNKVYSFGHSSVNVVIDRYMNPEHYAMLMASQANSGTFQLIEAHRNATLRELNQQLTHITEQMESLKKRAKELKGIPCNFRDALNLLDGPVRNNVHEMSQLGNLKNAMEMLRNVTTEQSAVNTNMNMMNTLSSFYGAGDGEGSVGGGRGLPQLPSSPALVPVPAPASAFAASSSSNFPNQGGAVTNMLQQQQPQQQLPPFDNYHYYNHNNNVNTSPAVVTDIPDLQAIMNSGVGHGNVNHVNMGHNNMQGMMMTTPGGGSTVNNLLSHHNQMQHQQQLPAAMASLPLRSPLELPLQLQQPNPHQQYQGNSSTYGDHLFNNNPNNDDTNAGYDHPFF